MAEWAFTPYETVSSILPGYTRNPYDLKRVTAGSSGGTAAAVAANIGSIDSDSVAVAQQDAIINQSITGDAAATADQSSEITQPDQPQP